MSVATQSNLVNRLVVAIREEIASHRQVLALLRTQEGAIRQPAGDSFRGATRDLEVELKRCAQRSSLRERAVVALATEFGVASSAATGGSLAERLGSDGDLLRAERSALIEVAKEVGQQNRRMATLVRLHRQVTRELIQVVLGPEDGGDVHAGGSLIDAEV